MNIHKNARWTYLRRLEMVQDLTPDSPESHAGVDASELPDLLMKIEADRGPPSIRFAMKLLALTFVRTPELIEAKWSEIDFGAAEWRIPLCA